VLKKVELTAADAGGGELEDAQEGGVRSVATGNFSTDPSVLPRLAGNIRASAGVTGNGKPTGDWKDLGMVGEAKDVAANMPIAATTLFASGKNVSPSGHPLVNCPHVLTAIAAARGLL